MIHERELEFRIQRFARIRTLMHHESRGAGADRARFHSDLRAQIDDFLSIYDVGAFRDAHKELNADRQFVAAFPGFSFGVNLFIDQLVDAAPDPDESRRILGSVLECPDDNGESSINRLLHYVERVRVGGQPARKDATTFLSFWWWVQRPRIWPYFWPDSEKGLKSLGWLQSDLDPAALYVSYVETVRSLYEDGELVEEVLGWASRNTLAPDSSICDRLAWAQTLDGLWSTDGYNPDVSDAASNNIHAVLADLRQFGDELREPVEQQLGRSLKRHLSPSREDHSVERYRSDAWVKWKLSEGEGWNEVPSIMVRFTATGAGIGFNPGKRDPGWAETIRPSLEEVAQDGATAIELSNGPVGQYQFAGFNSEYLIGYEVSADKIDPDTFNGDVIGAAAALQPVFDRAMSLIGIDVESQRPDLVALRDLFVSETGYPSDRHKSDVAWRDEHASHFAQHALGLLPREELRLVCNSSSYGKTGNQSNLNQTLRDSGDDFDQQMVKTLQYLLWGTDSMEIRIDRCLNDDEFQIRGFAEAGIMKLLAITHPDRVIPVFQMGGVRGKGELLDTLGLDRPGVELSKGERQMIANDRMREVLDPLFPGDPLAQARFAYWVNDRLSEPETDPIDTVVEDCYLPDRRFVDELVELLEDKRQIVLYGPPGTGKTFIARKLAEALAPSPEQRRFVQFHPSTSYEDFFEGYRPATDDSGTLTYQLTQGPFASLAEHAGQDPRRHVLVIDELNRANVPKVFGELLFLLEYRDAEVVPLYRQESFGLPPNVWVVATMNTADRSIATLDQALRRRFHFVPIFPDDGPMAGLLERFLEANSGDTRWAALVGMVNGELRDRLGSGDQLIGPSHFLRKNLDTTAMARIWRYNIEPLMDDLFYGDQATIQSFKWAGVLDRFREMSGGDPGFDASESFDDELEQLPDEFTGDVEEWS